MAHERLALLDELISEMDDEEPPQRASTATATATAVPSHPFVWEPCSYILRAADGSPWG
eukprot:CAMPEP_0183362850 /NCGR_PEP_ID=MMETSP0164_2-20130417/71911_1 /TAXON_ID=221442 /ORGANISM="Coccolithus pelagicus ssp braarudi, Strain PLY182g" /LENGTH=58 /DNA_ID=CAMNT_0025537819 /DNA_START=36 /DNA_END=209 /DNA_ORIENTATION=-